MTCSDTFYFEEITGRCRKCDGKCNNCEGNPHNCLECNLLDTNREDNAPDCSCLDGFFDFHHPVCEYCH